MGQHMKNKPNDADWTINYTCATCHWHTEGGGSVLALITAHESLHP